MNRIELVAVFSMMERLLELNDIEGMKKTVATILEEAKKDGKAGVKES